MEKLFVGVIGSIATVALIGVATRWLSATKGSPLPKTRDGVSFYGIKWEWRAVGLAGAVFAAIMAIWAWHDLHRPEWVLIVITVTFAVFGLVLASGSIATNESGITKRGIWHSRSFQWKDITEVRLHQKQGGAIELRSGAQKLVIDSRVNAFHHLLNEIEDHTQMRPTTTS